MNEKCSWRYGVRGTYSPRQNSVEKLFQTCPTVVVVDVEDQYGAEIGLTT